MHLLWLSKGHLDLALWEVKEYLSLSDYELYDDVLVAPTSFQEKEHALAYTKKFLSVWFSAEKESFLALFPSFPFGEMIKGTYAVRVPGDRALEKQLASQLHDLLPHTVDLQKPDHLLEVFVYKQQYYFGEVISKKDQQFSQRKSHQRPAPHPSSLDPRLARCMVNMLRTDQVIDPFCGSGGLLLEAGLSGCSVEGYDLEPAMIARAKKNCDHYGITASLGVKDATTLVAIPVLATDLPYGKNTKATDLKRLYTTFFTKVEIGKGIVGFPDNVDGKAILEQAGHTVLKTFTYYLHKSLSKQIILFTS